MMMKRASRDTSQEMERCGTDVPVRLSPSAISDGGDIRLQVPPIIVHDCAERVFSQSSTTTTTNESTMRCWARMALAAGPPQRR